MASTTRVCSCATYGACQVCRPAPILPRPTAKYRLPDLDQLPLFADLIDRPQFPEAVQRMADRVGAHVVDVTAGLYHLFAVLELGE